MELRVIDLPDPDEEGREWSRVLLITSVATREKIIPRAEATNAWEIVSELFGEIQSAEFDPNAPTPED